ncbi:MAG: CocE/NonD family hydrolase, partial [Deltaproteobacteria bacterium]|nr:CocE/NonD family hydrolase [Deltaproteobacteria bacterium]
MSEQQPEKPAWMVAYEKKLATWNAARQARPPAPDVPKIAPDETVMMPMRDGVRLFTELHFPKVGEGPFPTILIRTPYPDTTQPFSMAPIELFSSAGYMVATQSCRGAWKSEGMFRFFQNEPEDGYDCIEWIAEQPWSNGKVGMWGVSYIGSTQWLAARMRPPHLTCIAPLSPGGMFFYETPYIGGALFKWHLMCWPKMVACHTWDEMEFDYFSEERPAEGSPLYTALKQSPNIEAVKSWHNGDFVEAMLEPLEHPTRDDWWDRIMLKPETAADIDIPVFAITGFYDFDQVGCLYNWDLVEAHGDAGRGKRHLLVGPWRHYRVTSGQTVPVGKLTFGDNGNVPMPQVILDFFDA